MFSFPIFELIEKWVKKQGGWVYWIWLIMVGMIGTFFLKVWAEDGFASAKPLLLILLIIWVIGGLMVARHEGPKKETDNETPTDKSK